MAPLAPLATTINFIGHFLCCHEQLYGVFLLVKAPQLSVV